MKVENDMGERLHGKVGNMIYYTMNGKTYARRARIPGKPRKWETEGRSEKQRAVARRFKTLQRLYSYYACEVSAEIWRAAAKARGMMAANLFHSANKGCFDGEGRMTDPALFRFAEGELSLPPRLAVEPLGGGRFAVTWEAAEEWSSAAGTDRLRVGMLYDEALPFVSLAPEAVGVRGEGRGEFLVDTSHSGGAHAYVFFEREDGAAWSPSAHFPLEI